MILAIDTENTTWSTGNPFDGRNFNVCISTAYRDQASSELRTGVFFPEQRADFGRLLEKAELIVGFNLKYDLHWLKKLGFDIGSRRVYDCQIAEYVYSRQQQSYPSLSGCALQHLQEDKIDVIDREYWANGINTDAIPRPILAEYAAKDAELTLRLYEHYQRVIPEHAQKLLKLRMEDLKGLQEMEYNGLKFDREEVERRAAEAEHEIEQIKAGLDVHHNIEGFKWTSPAHLSALLYGGTIRIVQRVPTGVLFKSGKRLGEMRHRNELVEYHLPRQYKPVKGSETDKEGVYSVSEEYLRQLKGGGALIEGILRIKKLEKLNSTYLRGMLNKYEEMHLTGDIIHGQFNQCVTDTTRLSSSKPNLQNLAGDVKAIFRSRFEY